jgi:hypothetical protein
LLAIVAIPPLFMAAGFIAEKISKRSRKNANRIRSVRWRDKILKFRTISPPTRTGTGDRAQRVINLNN